MINKKLLLLVSVMILGASQTLYSTLIVSCKQKEPKMRSRTLYLAGRIAGIDKALRSSNPPARVDLLNKTRVALKAAYEDYDSFYQACHQNKAVFTLSSSGSDPMPGGENNPANYKNWETDKRKLVRRLQYLLSETDRLKEQSSGTLKDKYADDYNELKKCLDIYDAFYNSFEKGTIRGYTHTVKDDNRRYYTNPSTARKQFRKFSRTAEKIYTSYLTLHKAAKEDIKRGGINMNNLYNSKGRVKASVKDDYIDFRYFTQEYLDQLKNAFELTKKNLPAVHTTARKNLQRALAYATALQRSLYYGGSKTPIEIETLKKALGPRGGEILRKIDHETQRATGGASYSLRPSRYSW